jgi:hypothetical protein
MNGCPVGVVGMHSVRHGLFDGGRSVRSDPSMGSRLDAYTAIRPPTTARSGRATQSVHPVVGRHIEFRLFLLHLKRSRQSDDLFPDFRCQVMPSGDRVKGHAKQFRVRRNGDKPAGD